ncbi:MAG TPA: undecaprenyl-diphosphate phosphatase [Pseudobacteroides sp.]|uniref:undecaprenyl-diphosphate phosphatase n=1 Tax=Pseudobacteroides sp. TaxID=1968840 RepID=UPI002F956BFE
MDLIIKAIILGIVEGITEFLPISSTGHLILFGHFLGFTGKFAIMFEIMIQLGAILAVVFYYRNRILDSFKNIKPGQWGFKLWLWMLIAFLPSAVLGLVLNDYIEKYLFSPFTVSIALILGAVIILLVERKHNNAKNDNMLKVGAKKSLFIGFAQCMSLFPGMSRSASTIIGGVMVGLSVKAAAEFSFFLAIPTMFAATGYSLIKSLTSMTSTEWFALSVGFVVSFIVAFIVVGKFISFLGKHSLKAFAYYRLIVGIIMLLILGFR